MGKSPGKWIKSFLFGRKGSKSSLSTGRELSRSASEKPAQVSSKEPISTSIVDTPLISSLVSATSTVSNRINSSFAKGETAKLASEGQISSPSNKKVEDKPSDIAVPNDPGKITVEQAAIGVQAFFRGSQARNEFQTLKGVIKLQAAIRGHLVRRQAVATLFCMRGIVRFQAIAKGYMVRQARAGDGHCRKQSPFAKDVSNLDCEIKYNRAETLLKNAFICQLLASSRAAMPLHLEYSPGDPNSAWSWLHRWSTSQFWAPNIKQKGTGDSKPQTVEAEKTKSKRNGRRVPSVKVSNDPKYANAEAEKLKLTGRKLASHSVKSSQDHPQLDNDKVKRGVMKNQKPVGEICGEESDVSKPKRHQRKLSKSPAPKSSEQTSNTPPGKLMEHLAEPEAKVISNRSQDILPLEKDFKEEEIGSGSYKSSQTTSLLVKHDNQDVTLESVTRVPSYMAKTASSKAKVKAQVSPRFGQDATERNALTRRHSLPSSIGGKLILSPRVHKLIQSNGKEGTKIDRSLSSSREIADMVNHVEWKR